MGLPELLQMSWWRPWEMAESLMVGKKNRPLCDKKYVKGHSCCILRLFVGQLITSSFEHTRKNPLIAGGVGQILLIGRSSCKSLPLQIHVYKGHLDIGWDSNCSMIVYGALNWLHTGAWSPGLGHLLDQACQWWYCMCEVGRQVHALTKRDWLHTLTPLPFCSENKLLRHGIQLWGFV